MIIWSVFSYNSNHIYVCLLYSCFSEYLYLLAGATSGQRNYCLVLSFIEVHVNRTYLFLQFWCGPYRASQFLDMRFRRRLYVALCIRRQPGTDSAFHHMSDSEESAIVGICIILRKKINTRNWIVFVRNVFLCFRSVLMFTFYGGRYVPPKVLYSLVRDSCELRKNFRRYLSTST